MHYYNPTHSMDHFTQTHGIKGFKLDCNYCIKNQPKMDNTGS